MSTLKQQTISSFICILFCVTEASRDSGETSNIFYLVINTLIVSILFIYGAFIIFAIIQDHQWNPSEGPLWLFIPQILPCWSSSICFYIYLALPQHKEKLLLLSICQFQWILSSTFSMFVSQYLEMSSHIYAIYDEETIADFKKSMDKLPQNRYLIYGLFRKLNTYNNYTNWKHSEYRTLPSLHPNIIDIVVEFVGLELYEYPDFPSIIDNKEKNRDQYAKAITFMSSFVFLFNTIFVSIANRTTITNVFLLFVIVMDSIMFISHIIFSLLTIKVLLYHGDKVNHLLKYRVALAFSWLVMISEMIILFLFFLNGISDGILLIDILIVFHSLSLLGWYTTWIIEQLYVSLGSYDTM